MNSFLGSTDASEVKLPVFICFSTNPSFSIVNSDYTLQIMFSTLNIPHGVGSSFSGDAKIAVGVLTSQVGFAMFWHPLKRITTWGPAPSIVLHDCRPLQINNWKINKDN